MWEGKLFVLSYYMMMNSSVLQLIKVLYRVGLLTFSTVNLLSCGLGCCSIDKDKLTRGSSCQLLLEPPFIEFAVLGGILVGMGVGWGSGSVFPAVLSPIGCLVLGFLYCTTPEPCMYMYGEMGVTSSCLTYDLARQGKGVGLGEWEVRRNFLYIESSHFHLLSLNQGGTNIT